MPTEKQIDANRRNSQKSTGPRTDSGKARSSMNALKTGVHAESHCILGEDPAVLAQLAAEYNAEFHPTSPRRRDLVDTLVHDEWQVRRLRRLETALWDHMFENKEDQYDNPNNSYHVRQRKHPHAAAFGDLEDRLERLQRRLHAYERSAARALRQLQALESTSPSDEIGFVPSNPVEQASRPAMPAIEPACDNLDRPVTLPTAGRPISEHLPSRAIPVTDCAQTDYRVADKVPENPTR